MIRLCDKLSRSNMAVRNYGPDIVLGMGTLWPWSWRYDLGSRSWHTLWSWTTIVWIIQIQQNSEELWPGHGFSVCVHCDLDLGDMNLVEGHDTPLGHGTTIVWIIQIQHGSEELWPGHRFWVCVDCDLDDMTLGQGQDTPFGHEQCDTMWTDGQTDRRTDRVIPIYPQTLFAGGITKCILVTMVYYKCTTSKLSLALLKSYKEIQMQFLVWIMYGKHVYVLINDSWILFLKTRLHNLIWKFCI